MPFTVSDSVPEWVYSETYAQIAEQAEKDALAAVGISMEEDDSNSAAIDAFNTKLNTFQDKQFAQWCSDTGVTYSTASEKDAALEKYKQAPLTDPEHFKDGIYIPDSTAEDKYSQLLAEKKKIVANSSITSQVYNQFQNSLSKVTSEIQAREGSWNQDRGHALTSISSGGTTPAGGGSGGSGVTSSNANVEKMVQWAINTANDQSHGYSQSARTGPDYDCSSFVYYALENAGFKVVSAKGYPGDASTIWGDLQSLGGWQKYSWSSVNASLVRGDILCNPEKHAAIYIGNGKTVEAHGVSFGSPETGDQGEEIDFGGIEGRSFTEVYRCTTGSDNGSSSSSTNTKIEAAVKFAESKVGGSYSQEESQRNGPNSYDCSSLIYWSLDAAGFGIIAAWRQNPDYQNQYHGNQQVGDVNHIWTDIQKMGGQGWTKYTYSAISGQLKRGDIVAYWESSGSNGHAYFMTDNNNTVEAAGTAEGICRKTKRASYDVQEVYRYTG